EIEDKLGLKAKKLENGLSLLVEGGDKFIPRLFERLDIEILSVNLKKPSLEDVFINLTGRNIRDNGAPARFRGA
ncbi:MAG: ABC transporter ATP-binding protein, partial [Deltaproteobacteria bacterium]